MICRMKMFCGVSSRHDGHSYVCSMGLWFLLRTVCCNCCKRSDTQHSLLCSLCSVSVLQWPQKMTSQCQQRLSFCSIDIFFCNRVDIHQFGCHHLTLSGHIVEHLVCCVVADDLLDFCSTQIFVQDSSCQNANFVRCI